MIHPVFVSLAISYLYRTDPPAIAPVSSRLQVPAIYLDLHSVAQGVGVCDLDRRLVRDGMILGPVVLGVIEERYPVYDTIRTTAPTIRICIGTLYTEVT